MTTVTIVKSGNGTYTGLHVSGHAMYAQAGSDIVCAAVSMLTINTVNSIDQFTDDHVTVSQDEETGILEASFAGKGGQISKETALLMQSFEMGVTELAKQYKEVQVQVVKRGSDHVNAI